MASHLSFSDLTTKQQRILVRLSESDDWLTRKSMEAATGRKGFSAALSTADNGKNLLALRLVEQRDSNIPYAYRLTAIGRQLASEAQKLDADRDQKACRICWNTNGWRYPSGEAQALERGSFAKKFGFGHEEWLFNYEWIFEGKRYGFLQPLGKYPSFKGMTFDVLLYTVAPNGERLLVGTIANVTCLEDADRERYAKYADERGWLKQAEAHLREIDVVPTEEANVALANVKFDPANVTLFNPMLAAIGDYSFLSSSRYQPFNWDGLIPAAARIAEPISSSDVEYRSEQDRTRAAQKGVTYSPTHVRMQNNIHKLLVAKFGKNCVHYERGFVDLAVEIPGGVCFIEVKTANSAKQCIREALGQLLEYSHYPELSKATELLVIGDAPLTSNDASFVRLLNEQYKLHVQYAQYLWEKNCLTALPSGHLIGQI